MVKLFVGLQFYVRWNKESSEKVLSKIFVNIYVLYYILFGRDLTNANSHTFTSRRKKLL